MKERIRGGRGEGWWSRRAVVEKALLLLAARWNPRADLGLARDAGLSTDCDLRPATGRAMHASTPLIDGYHLEDCWLHLANYRIPSNMRLEPAVVIRLTILMQN